MPTSSKASTAYSFSFSSLTSEEDLTLASFQGKVLLIVNTASQCSFTSQYDGLEKLYQTYKEQGLVVIGVPSNDFGHQEPDLNKNIATFCQKNYGVHFPMAGKESVRGQKAHPFYQWARQCLGFWGAPRWNFHKYLIDQQGYLVDFFYTTTPPTHPKLAKAIQTLLQRSDSHF